jgi:hypothetical protein
MVTLPWENGGKNHEKNGDLRKHEDFTREILR